MGKRKRTEKSENFGRILQLLRKSARGAGPNQTFTQRELGILIAGVASAILDQPSVNPVNPRTVSDWEKGYPPQMLAHTLRLELSEENEREVWRQVYRHLISTTQSPTEAPRENDLVQAWEELWIPAAYQTSKNTGAISHWRQAIRGSDSHGIPYFTGRKQALLDLVQFATQETRGSCVVTGTPGAGKSALLGLTVLASRAHPETNTIESAQLIPRSLVNAAINCHSLNKDEVVNSLLQELDLASTKLGSERDDLFVIEGVEKRGNPVLIFDGLDEAQDAGQIARLLYQLSWQARVIVGTRRTATEGKESLGLPKALGHPKLVIDLDRPPWLQDSDIVDYLVRRLSDDQRPSGYSTTSGAGKKRQVRRVAAEASRFAKGNFLVAQYVAEDLLATDPIAPSTANWVENRMWPERLEDWIERDLRQRLDNEFDRVLSLLTPLAYAEQGGISVDVWFAMARTLNPELTETARISWAIDKVPFYISRSERSDDSETRFIFRHEAFAQYVRSRSRWDRVQRALTDALLELIPRQESNQHLMWHRAPSYVRTNIVRHASKAGRLQELVEKYPGLLPCVDPWTLLPLLPLLLVGGTRHIAATYQRAANVLENESFETRAAYLHFHASALGHRELARAMENLGKLPWRVGWRGGPPAGMAPIATIRGKQVVDLVIPDLGSVALAIDNSQGIMFDLAGLLTVGSIDLPGISGNGHLVAFTGVEGESLLGEVHENLSDFVEVLSIGFVSAKAIGRLHQEATITASSVLRTSSSDLLITGGQDGSVLLWSVDSKKKEQEPIAHLSVGTGEVNQVTASRSLIAAGSSKGELKAWTIDESSDKIVTILDATVPQPVDLLLQTDLPDQILISVSRSGQALTFFAKEECSTSLRMNHQFDKSTAERVQEILLAPWYLGSRLLMLQLSTDRIEQWVLEKGQQPKRILPVEPKYPIDKAAIIAAAPTTLLATVERSGLTRVYAVEGERGDSRIVSAFSQGQVRSVTPLKHAELPIFASTSWHQDVVKLWLVDPSASLESESPISANQRIHVLQATDHPLKGNIAAILTAEDKVLIWQIPEEQGVSPSLPELPKQEETEHIAILSTSHAPFLTTCSVEGNLDVWNLLNAPFCEASGLKHGDVVRILTVVSGITEAAFATTGWDGTTHVWRRGAEEWAKARTVQSGETVSHVASLIDAQLGSILITGGAEEGLVKAWRLEVGGPTDGRENTKADITLRFDRPVEEMAILSTLENGSLVSVAGGEDGFTSIWRLDEGDNQDPISVFNHGTPVKQIVSLRQSEGMPAFVTRSTSTLKYWDLGLEKMTPREFDAPIEEITALVSPSIRPDGLAVATADNKLFVWTPGHQPMRTDPLVIQPNCEIQNLKWLPGPGWLLFVADEKALVAIEPYP